MVQEFNLSKVIEHFRLNTEDVANALFPHVRYKKLALDRIIRENLPVDTRQLNIIANLAGVLVSDLFLIDTWKGSTEDNCITFLKGDYKAKLNYNGSWLSFYKNNELLTQEAFTFGITLDQFIEHINELAQTYSN